MSKAKRRTQKRSNTWKKALLGGGALAVVSLAAVAAWLAFDQSDGALESTVSSPRAAIVDQLSLTAPNADFAGEATSMLAAAGYSVDYFPGEDVTVEFYRDLPSHGYDVILLRAHAAGQEFATQDHSGENVTLFTSEPVSADKYLDEQDERLVRGVGYTARDMQDGNLYFGIPPAFVESEMRGSFDGATVVLMGCGVLRAQKMANAFIDRGAQAVVGWNAQVSADHTDAATLSLLRHLLDDGLTPQQAAAAAMKEVGPDPYYDSVFVAYPPTSTTAR